MKISEQTEKYLRRLSLLSIIIAMPFIFKSNYYRGILVGIGIYSIVVIGLNMLIGYAGQVSLGHAGLFGLSAPHVHIDTLIHNIHNDRHVPYRNTYS